MNTAQAHAIRLAGDRFERRVMNRVKQGALFCQRTAGSYGQADVMAVMPSGIVRLIQCKTNGYIEPGERRALAKLWERLPANVRLEVFWRKTMRTMGRKIITDPAQLEMFATKQGV